MLRPQYNQDAGQMIIAETRRYVLVADVDGRSGGVHLWASYQRHMTKLICIGKEPSFFLLKSHFHFSQAITKSALTTL